jgi:hypothetical protein
MCTFHCSKSDWICLTSKSRIQKIVMEYFHYNYQTLRIEFTNSLQKLLINYYQILKYNLTIQIDNYLQNLYSIIYFL